jgi:pimeloyl-ACP methyl ester carboxylesterase
MGEKIPRARLSVIEGAGHAVHLERSGDLATLMGF